uniref:Sauvatide n=1 Tax=Phyllomedusa sauvagei TaxID=8395 RepID=SAUVE_PHYSA|nr:RecName: Full=Sauvatide; Flags: Precursor [Phyllomedusa sauvagii]CAX48601.1 sauvatide precusor [Phyllomedusa sauvagii]
MDILKKSLFLILFLGLVSISFCDGEKRQDDDEANESEEKKEIHEVEKRLRPAILVRTKGKGK